MRSCSVHASEFSLRLVFYPRGDDIDSRSLSLQCGSLTTGRPRIVRDTAFESTASSLPGTPVANQAVVVAVEDETDTRRELAEFRVTNAWESPSTKGRDLIVTPGLERTNKIKIHQPGKNPPVISSSRSEFARGTSSGQIVGPVADQA